MPPIFSLDKREEIQIKLLESGISLIREKGIKRMTVDDVTESVGIGKGTFYHFFQSKEWYVYEVIRFSKENLLSTVNKLVTEKGGIDRESLISLFQTFSFTGPNNIISFMTAEDETWLAKKLPPKYVLDFPKEDKIIALLLDHLIGARENINTHVLANLMKIMALAVENKRCLHQDALNENLSLMQKQLCDLVFND